MTQAITTKPLAEPTPIAPQTTKSPRWPSTLPLGLSMLLLILVVVWTVVAGYLVHQHRQAEHDAYETSVNLARGFGESVARTIEAMDQVFAMLRAFHRADAARFDIRALAPSDQMLTDLTLQIAVVDEKGMLRGSNLGGPPVDLSDREHIRVHLDRPGDFLFVSKPVLGRVSKKWSIQLTRKLLHPDGALAGVLVISLDPTYFARFYESFNTPRGAIALVGLDGVFRARAPLVEALQATTVDPATMALLVGSNDTGTWRAPSQIDGVDRLFAFRRLDKYGLAVTVGLAASEVFAKFNQQVVLFVAIGLGISALVVLFGQSLIRSTQRLRDSQRALSATLENMNQGIIMIDAQGHVPVINQRAVELLDLPPGVAQPGASFGAILQWQLDRREFATEASAIDVDALARSGGMGPAAYERQRPNGTVLEVQTRELPDGGAVRTFTDITERREAEARLRALQAEAMRGARVTALGAMAAGLAHELNQPLSAVTNYASAARLLVENAPEQSPWLMRLDHMLDRVETQAQRAGDIVRRLRDFISGADRSLGMVEVAPLVADAITLFADAGTTQRPITMEVAEDCHSVFGDRQQLLQVLSNLLRNAIEAVAEQTAGEVRIAARSIEDGMVEISVSDNGPGLAPGLAERLFEPFQTTKTGGLGIGLAICRTIVEVHGGKISAESAAGGVGTVFRVALPSTVGALQEG
jgi:signal transduction histidine kinase